jgi:hypothetical protein
VWLLRRAHAALARGRVFVQGVLRDDPDYPGSRPAVMHLLMGLSYRSQSYTSGDLGTLLAEAGFEAPVRRHRFNDYTLSRLAPRAAPRV